MAKKQTEPVFDEMADVAPAVVALPEEEAAERPERDLSAVEHLEIAIGKLEGSRSTVHGEAYRYIAGQLRFFAEKLKTKGAI